MKDNKYSLVVIVLLLIIVLPLTILGYIYRQNNKVEENPNHEFFYEGYLWFYDDKDAFINKYECKNQNCNLAKASVDDEEYNINYYKNGDIEDISIISNSYAFIEDGDLIYLYDINRNQILQDYIMIKNYNTTLSEPIFIIKDSNGLWGVLYADTNIDLLIPYEYSFIGLVNKLNEDNEIIVDNFIVLKEGQWYLVNGRNEKLSSEYVSPIVDYNDRYIVTKDKEDISIYDYIGEEYFKSLNIEKYILEQDFVGAISNNTLYVYSSLSKNVVYTKDISDKTGNITLEYKENTLYILENDIVIDTVS